MSWDELMEELDKVADSSPLVLAPLTAAAVVVASLDEDGVELADRAATMWDEGMNSAELLSSWYWLNSPDDGTADEAIERFDVDAVMFMRPSESFVLVLFGELTAVGVDVVVVDDGGVLVADADEDDDGVMFVAAFDEPIVDDGEDDCGR